MLCNDTHKHKGRLLTNILTMSACECTQLGKVVQVSIVLQTPKRSYRMNIKLILATKHSKTTKTQHFMKFPQAIFNLVLTDTPTIINFLYKGLIQIQIELILS